MTWGNVAIMRTRLSSALLLSLVSAACGGGQAQTGGPQAISPAPTSDSPFVDAAASPQGAAATGPATTTLILGDAGELQGAKLTETHTVVVPASSAGAAPKPPHGHDPGRGLSDIRAIVVAHRDAARACYDKGLVDHPGIEGDLVVQWTIDPKGNVTDASLDVSRSQISESTTVACVLEIIKKLQFAPSQGGFESKAFYPFNFHPHHGQPKPAP